MGKQQNCKPMQPCCVQDRFRDYFKIGVADDFILIRDDFPMTEISPGDFSRLIKTMFQRNDEVRSHGK